MGLNLTIDFEKILEAYTGSSRTGVLPDFFALHPPVLPLHTIFPDCCPATSAATLVFQLSSYLQL